MLCTKCGVSTTDEGDLHCRRNFLNEVKKILSFGDIDKAKIFVEQAKFNETWKEDVFARLIAEPLKQRNQLRWEAVKEERRQEESRREREFMSQIAQYYIPIKNLLTSEKFREADTYVLMMQMENPNIPIWEKYNLMWRKVEAVRVAYTQRHDWDNFYTLLEKENISSFVHITDATNLPSIMEHGGLFSNEAMKDLGISPSVYASTELSRSLDAHRGISDYIHLSVQKSPMMYAGRIGDPVELKIDARFVYAQETKFSDKNAVDGDAKIGQNFEDFEQINFKIANGRWGNEDEKKLFQAEILVKHHIPIEFIEIPEVINF